MEVDAGIIILVRISIKQDLKIREPIREPGTG
jgi:hypothetical protein